MTVLKKCFLYSRLLVMFRRSSLFIYPTYRLAFYIRIRCWDLERGRPSSWALRTVYEPCLKAGDNKCLVSGCCRQSSITLLHDLTWTCTKKLRVPRQDINSIYIGWTIAQNRELLINWGHREEGERSKGKDKALDKHQGRERGSREEDGDGTIYPVPRSFFAVLDLPLFDSLTSLTLTSSSQVFSSLFLGLFTVQ